MDAWIKLLLVQESRASWQIKNDCTVCCRTGEKESEGKEEKARSGRLTLYLINQSEKGIGKAASATFGSEGACSVTISRPWI